MSNLVLILVALGVLAPAPPGEWPRFRGPNGSGVAVTGTLPAEFGPARNVVWKTQLPPGYSSPIVSGNRIYLTGFRAEQLLSFALDLATGKVIWERPAPRNRREKLDQRNHPASPSAATDGERVYFFFADYGLEAMTINDLQDSIYATPALVGNRIYIRTLNALYCFGAER